MKTLFLHVPNKVCKGDEIFYYSIMIMPHSLFCLSNLLSENGHQVEILHLGIEEGLNKDFNLEHYIESNNFEVVCVPLHWHFQIYWVLQTVRKIKTQLPEIKIVLGGFTASYFFKEIMEHCPEVDFLIRGDGEKPIVALMEALEQGNDNLYSVPNLCFRQSEKTVYNELNYVATQEEIDALCFSNLSLLKHYDYYDGMFYQRIGGSPPVTPASKIFYLFTGRGCSVNCAFCGGAKNAQKLLYERHHLIFRKEEKVMEDIQNLVRFNYKMIYFCFDPPRKKYSNYYHNLFNKIQKNMLSLSSIFEFYNNVPDDRFLTQFAETFDLRESQIAFSPNSADEQLRGFYNGYFYKNNELEKVLLKAKNLNINTTVYFTLFPKDSFKTVNKTAAWMRRLSENYGSKVVFMPIEVEPASLWYENPEKFGISLTRVGFDSFLKRHAPSENTQRFENKVGYSLRGAYKKYQMLKEASFTLQDQDFVQYIRFLYDE